MSADPSELRCSFCGKPQSQCFRMIAGTDVYICDECTELCSQIVHDEVEIEYE